MGWFSHVCQREKVPLLPVQPGAQPTHKRGDICTSAGGLVDRNAALHLDNLTRLVADVKMVHVFSTQDHTYKSTNIKAAEQEKWAKYKMYVTAGFGFGPAVVNTFGQLGPDLLRIGWKWQQPSERPAASFGDFEFWDNETNCDEAWTWLRTFDLTKLLIKRHEMEAPSDEEGRQLWRK